MEQDQLGTSVLYVEISYRTGGLIRAQSCNPGIEIEAGAVFCATKTLDQTPISSIGSGIAPTLQLENSTVNTRPPRALFQSQKWDRANSKNSEKPSERPYTLDAIYMMSPAVSVELISV